ncbi:hypothetical protein FA13DRAFT_1718777 [Coprinellus micaceus]|uniref:Uncharacterized protein n=1 Tax=Coprinellus micaceus TaxID=71717 RepID=A0A4Y7SDM8_COPMI|nr:hypothetical protein FA13DRAFT_1718777 [Coprinellus micaceus]
MSEVLLDAGMDKIKRNARFREKNPYASNVDGGIAVGDDEGFGNQARWAETKYEREDPRQLYTNPSPSPGCWPATPEGARPKKRTLSTRLVEPDVRGKRGPAPFPVDLSQREPTPTRPTLSFPSQTPKSSSTLRVETATA